MKQASLTTFIESEKVKTSPLDWWLSKKDYKDFLHCLNTSAPNNVTKKGNMIALDIGLVDYIIEEIYMTYCPKTQGDSNLLHNSVPLIHPTLKPKSSMQLVSSIKNSIHDTKVEASTRDKIREFAFV